jgi:hypothetical protein
MPSDVSDDAKTLTEQLAPTERFDEISRWPEVKSILAESGSGRTPFEQFNSTNSGVALNAASGNLECIERTDANIGRIDQNDGRIYINAKRINAVCEHCGRLVVSCEQLQMHSCQYA